MIDQPCDEEGYARLTNKRYAAAFTFFKECLEHAPRDGTVVEDQAVTRLRADLLRRARDCGAVGQGEAAT